MTKETDFVRIKKAVELQKTKKMQGEARMDSLDKEESRILVDIEELTGKSLLTTQDVDTYVDGLRSEIEEHITEIKQILDSEGVVY